MTNLQPSSPQNFTPEFLQLILPDRLNNPAAGVMLYPDNSVYRSPKIVDFPSKYKQAVGVSVQTWACHKTGLPSEEHNAHWESIPSQAKQWMGSGMPHSWEKMKREATAHVWDSREVLAPKILTLTPTWNIFAQTEPKREFFTNCTRNAGVIINRVIKRWMLPHGRAGPSTPLCQLRAEGCVSHRQWTGLQLHCSTGGILAIPFFRAGS